MDETVSTRFPSIGWAWPKGDLDRLLFSAIHPDHSAAMVCFEDWLNGNDINAVTFREHRLLAAIAFRFGKKLAKHPEYPRLVGLQRMLWTKSRMAIRETLPALAAMIDAGIDVVLFKGASRIAIDADSQQGRVAHDIDVLVPARRFGDALNVLWNDGWQSASGESHLRLQSRAPAISSMNFFKGHFGDIDMHQMVYPVLHTDHSADSNFWTRKVAAEFFGLKVSVPSPEERLALAVAHGALDGHTHSDWLVDCAATIRHQAVNWVLFLKIVRARNLRPQALIALSYLKYRLALEIPADAMTALSENDRRVSVGYISTLLQAKPRTDWGLLSMTGRGIAKQFRLNKLRRLVGQEVRKNCCMGRVRWADEGDLGSQVACVHMLEFKPVTTSTTARCMVKLSVALPPVRRRLEFEINTSNRHVLRLRARIFSKRGGTATITFAGKLVLTPDDTALSIEARPGKQLRERQADHDHQKYAALPFRVLRFSST